MAPNNKRPSAYEIFSSVDEKVAKPVLGSDGAASWQAFEKGRKRSKPSVAPKAPLKAADRAAGFSSWEDERKHEEQERANSGHKSLVDSGYTVFKKKQDEDEKPIDWVARRKLPDKTTYYIASDKFDGWKFDYIFTTRNRGTGYYWDGMDSLKEKAGIFVPPKTTQETVEDGAVMVSKKKKRKNKKRDERGPVFIDDPSNPIQQISEALRQQHEKEWQSARDASTGKTYYYNTRTRERTWILPKSTGDTLPEGWQTVKDPASGKDYYFHATTKETRWERPVQP